MIRTAHRSLRIATLLAAIAILAACGYAKSGTWDDDSGNWSRAFDTTKPDDVVVTHSHYWRGAHWTYEFEYCFEFEPNAALRKQLFGENKLARLEGDAAERARTDHFGKLPDWFAPGAADDYEIWAFADDPGSNFVLLIHKRTGVLFLKQSQV